MPTSPDLFADRIHQSVSHYTENECDALQCRLSKEWDTVSSDRKFVQKLKSVFPE
ncbi:hypothetical protein [Methanogenium sp. MK-MG]|uniref:hypothetical protein n=1 Tax=Methanogenium sp. MK-MG TaxID=2599926 RepID=UPI0013ED5F91|nr:hypothetical protein [Methanogenium sp. MK-MG]KAF1078534.1 hypothetical protein MKMG_00494 [Methanogenium sp. MK-MG]